jgi:hypothetical protein
MKENYYYYYYYYLFIIIITSLVLYLDLQDVISMIHHHASRERLLYRNAQLLSGEVKPLRSRDLSRLTIRQRIKPTPSHASTLQVQLTSSNNYYIHVNEKYYLLT